jgi:TRAP transporter TAXI family solute receptor
MRIRTLIPILAATMILSLLAGCGSRQQSSQTQPAAAAQPAATPAPAKAAPAAPVPSKDPIRVSVPSGTTGGSYYAYLSGASEVLRKHSNIELTVQTSPGAAANMDLLVSKKGQMAPTSNSTVHQASTGTERYKDKGKTELRQVLAMFSSPFYVTVRKNSTFKSIWGFKGVTISVGGKGSGTLDLNQFVFDAIGLKVGTDLQPEYSASKEAIDSWKDNRIQGVVNSAGSMPYPSVTEMSTLGDGIRIFSLTDEEIQKVIKKYPFFSPYVIPKGSYAGQDYEVKTVAVWTSLVATPDLPDEVAYNIIKVLDEHQPELVQAYKPAKETSAVNTVKGAIVPLHPGVEKYLKEKGIPTK